MPKGCFEFENHAFKKDKQAKKLVNSLNLPAWASEVFFPGGGTSEFLENFFRGGGQK